MTNKDVSMHTARMAFNRDSQLRAWAEEWLKEKERAAQPAMTIDEFEKHWKFVRPERLHEGALEAFSAFMQRNQDH